MPGKVVLITGASSGIGFATALELLEAGHTVYGGARRVDQMEPIVTAGGHAIALDVTDEASMVAAVDAVIAAEGHIDVLINNAGYATYGAVEEIPLAEGRRQLEVNIFGLVRMTQLVLPGMRERRSGRIINVSSMGGTIWTPLGAWYHGTKWFVEGFTNAMRLELKSFNIHPVMIAPGLINTGFNSVLANELAKTSDGSAYSEIIGQLSGSADPGSGSDPRGVALAMRRAVEDRKPKAIYRAGQMARLLPALARILPRYWFDAMVMFGLRRGS